MNWMIVGIVFVVLGLTLSVVGPRRGKRYRSDNELPQLVQYGYLSVIVGAFILLVQCFSIAAAMLVFVGVTGIFWGIGRCWSRWTSARLPSWIDYGRSFFPVIFAVFVLRSFIIEPYQIPSSSMRPGLVVGDFILVSKSSYGIRIPILNTILIPTGTPQHGDVMVFNSPEDPSINYIKRVIGLPGDTVVYREGRLIVNGEPVETTPDGERVYQEDGMAIQNAQFREHYGQHRYQTLLVPEQPSVILSGVRNYPYRDHCRYDESGFECNVPVGHYFTMGDNRSHSLDSRYWGFVSDKYVVGKAFFVWMNFRELSRIGTIIP